jgi:hypothetical protein
MYTRIFLTSAAFLAMVVSAGAQNFQRRATITGRGNPDEGKCTIEVVVDGAAEVEVRSDTATLRNIWGQPPQWRRFECTSPMPPNSADFRFAGVDGRGKQQLIRDPRSGGSAVVRIEDPQSGAEGYTFDLFWRGGAGYPTSQQPLGQSDRGGWGRDRGAWGRNGGGRFGTDEAVRVCQDEVRRQAFERFQNPDLTFRRTNIDDNPGRNDWVVGTFDVRRGFGRVQTFRFSCSVDFDSGRVRSATFEPLEGGASRYGLPDNNGVASGRAIQNCERMVEQRLRNDGYQQTVDFGQVNVENDRVVGTARIGSRYPTEWFEFTCAANPNNGSIGSVEVRRR